MPDPNAIVSSFVRFDPELERPVADLLAEKTGVTVELEGERSALLDPADPRSPGFALVLQGLAANKLPVYIEVHPDTSAIARLLIPHVTRVIRIDEVDDGTLAIELERSHARHTLHRDARDYAALEPALREALRSGDVLIITEDDDHEIIDIRGFTPGPEGVPPPFPHPERLPRPPWPWRWLRCLFDICCWWPWRWPWWWCRCISTSKAQQVFDAMKATSCDPLTVPAPCIPFLYPDDGCWGRAHEMCRLMIDMRLKPKKVWIQGSLHVDTANSPNCYVNWGWHVAPTLCVHGPGLFKVRQMVIDPSLFDVPVSKATWKSIQGDANATLTDSNADIFYLWGNVTDPGYIQTNQVLATYRLQLQNRAVQHGPPPYPCP